MTAVGLDVGGTKIEAQVFDDTWGMLDSQRVATPKTYPELIAAIAESIRWAQSRTADDIAIGIGAAGLIDPVSGTALTANICASGQTIPADIAAAIGRPITYLNDCRALTLSEAVFGAGRPYKTVASVILGTGVGGGIAVDRTLLSGPTQTGGEFGHCAAPAHLIARYDLPLVACGCGQTGCIESYISGPGLERMALALTGKPMTSRTVADARGGDAKTVWEAWCALTADMLRTLILTVDPDVIVFGGGLSNITGLVDDLTGATRAAQIGDFPIPPLVLAQGGDASGARGAAYAAWMAQQ